jgi:multiple sugar transport system ATP-binding protein
MVFQSYALYPHLTVAENIAFGLRVRGFEAGEVDRKVKETAELLELTEYLHRKPSKLSGGQRQRVAMGRALVRSPNAFLMDEPLSNLDARLRGQMRSEISKLQRMSAVTTIYVTHDQVEAMTMGDRVAVMNKGELQQLDAPRALYDRPKNLFVASFIGTPPINFLRGAIIAENGAPAVRIGALTLGLGNRPVSRSRTDRPVIVGIRPEALRIATDDEAGLKVVAAFVEDLGATLLLHLDSPEAEVVPASVVEDDVDLEAVRPRLRAVVDGSLRIANGDRLVLTVDPAALHLFDASTGDAL